MEAAKKGMTVMAPMTQSRPNGTHIASNCQLDPSAMDQLIGVTRDNSEQIGALADEIKTLTGQYKEQGRWMLLAIIIIALGNAATQLLLKFVERL